MPPATVGGQDTVSTERAQRRLRRCPAGAFDGEDEHSRQGGESREGEVFARRRACRSDHSDRIMRKPCNNKLAGYGSMLLLPRFTRNVLDSYGLWRRW